MSVLRRRGRGDQASGRSRWSRNTALTLGAGASIIAAGVLVPVLLLGGSSMLHWPVERKAHPATPPLVVGGRRPQTSAHPASGAQARVRVAPVATPVIAAAARVPQVTGPVTLPPRVRARRNAPPASRHPARTVAPHRPSVSAPVVAPAPVPAPVAAPAPAAAPPVVAAPVAPAPVAGAPAPAPVAAVPTGPHAATPPRTPPGKPTPAPPAQRHPGKPTPAPPPHRPPGTPTPVSTPAPPTAEPAPSQPPSPPTAGQRPRRLPSPKDQREDRGRHREQGGEEERRPTEAAPAVPDGPERPEPPDEDDRHGPPAPAGRDCPEDD